MQKEKLTDTQREIVEANLGLARMAAWKFRDSCAKVGIDWDDAYSIACMGLMKAARLYDPTLSRPSVYLTRGCETAIMMELRRYRQPSRCVTLTTYLSAPVSRDKEGNELTLEDILEAPGPAVDDECCTTILIDKAMQRITPRQREILCLMQEGLNQHEIGRIIGCSQSYVSRLMNACKKRIQEAIA